MKNIRFLKFTLLAVFLIAALASTSATAQEKGKRPKASEIHAWAKDKNFIDFVKLDFTEASQNRDSQLIPKEFLSNPCEENTVGKLKDILAVYDSLSVNRLKMVCYKSDIPEVILGNNTLLLFSDRILKDWSESEVRAAVGHEIFHGAFVREFGESRVAGDFDALQAIELKCDALAIHLLKHFGLETKSLKKVLKKQENFMKGNNIYLTTTDKTHPEFAIRYTLIELMTEE